ncbi:hypothetical protein M569_03119, partial [Genlisea aurea]
QKYGVPLYGAAWVPNSASNTENDVNSHVIVAGGGGEGHSGIPNALLLSKFDSESSSLSSQPVSRHGTGSELPYRIAVHPGGEGIICSFPKSCCLFEWNQTDEQALSLRSSERLLEPLQDIGQQLALAFNADGNLLAVGGEDGKLKVFKWPTLEIVINDENAHTRLNDLDFSADGKFLVSLGTGIVKVWDTDKSTSIASLHKQHDERFGFCRFSRVSDHVLYTTAMRDKGGSIVKWNTNSWERIISTLVTRDSVSAFNVSPDGKLLAIGTAQGGVVIINSGSMRVQTVIKKAHIGITTSLAFSPDSRALLSASMDSSVGAALVESE